MITRLIVLDFAYFKNNYKLIAADLSKQKAIDADSIAIQQIIFAGKTDGLLHFWTIKRSNTRIF